MSLGLQFKHKCGDKDAAMLDIVYIHGITGDPEATWTNSAGVFWPCWLVDDLADVCVHTAGYPSSLFERWAKREMNLHERASSLIEHMVSHGIGKRPLIIVCHSLGGLLAKEMLRACCEARDESWNALGDHLRLIIFFATPHKGAALAAILKALLPRASSPSIDALSNDSGYLTNLNNGYRDLAVKKGLTTLAYYEVYKTKNMALVVSEDTADPGCTKTRPIPVDADHIGICKPESREEPVYTSVRRHIAEVLDDCLATNHSGPELNSDPSDSSAPAEKDRSALQGKRIDTVRAHQYAKPDNLHYSLDRTYHALSSLRTLTRQAIFASGAVRGGDKGGTVSLRDGLYVVRDIEADLLERLRSGHYRASPTLLTGPPGVGKTSLLWSINRKLTEDGEEAWFVDADAFMLLAGDFANHGIGLEGLLELFNREDLFAHPPVLAIDTADIILNSNEKADKFLAMLGHLAESRLKLMVASRPEEAHALKFLEPHQVALEDFSDAEFPVAVANYAARFIDPALEIDAGEVADNLLSAAAQWLQLSQVARNPLMLRMMFTIYAPDVINFQEVNVISLYRDYWSKRVEDDIRSESRHGETGAEDCSAVAALISVAMVSLGTVTLAKEQAVSMCRKHMLPRRHLDILLARGVLETIGEDRRPVVRFFHQTFMEHAAAVAMTRINSSEFLSSVFEKYVASSGEFFLGCILERALVLAEDAHPSIDARAEEMVDDLLQMDGATVAPAVFAYAHRDRISGAAEEHFRKRLERGDGFALERLLAMAPNMPKTRVAATVPLFCKLLEPQALGRNARILAHLARAAAVAPRVVLANLRDMDLHNAFTARPLETGLERTEYFVILDRLMPEDPEWVLPQILDLFGAAARRRAGEKELDSIVRLLEKHRTLVEARIGSLTAYVSRTLIENPGGNRGIQQNSEEKSRSVARLFRGAHLSDGRWVLGEIARLETSGRESLLFWAHLNALALSACDATPEELATLAAQSVDELDPEKLINFANVVWPQVLDTCFLESQDELCAVVELLKDIKQSRFGHGGETSYLMLVLRSRRIGIQTVIAAAVCAGLDSYDLWRDHRQLYSRLVVAANAGHPPAINVLEETIADLVPGDTRQAALMTQLKAPGCEEIYERHGLEVALLGKNPADRIIEYLNGLESFPSRLENRVNSIWKVCDDLEARGDPVSRIRHYRIVAQLQRLRVRGNRSWTWLCGRAQQETNPDAAEALFKAIRYVVFWSDKELDERLDWLLANVRGKSTKARIQAFNAISNIFCRDIERFGHRFYEFFEHTFEEETETRVILPLSHPLYQLNDLRAPRLNDYCVEFVEKTRGLTSKTNHGLFERFSRLYLSVGQRAGSAWCFELLKHLPGLHAEVARMLIPLVMNLSEEDYSRLRIEVFDAHQFDATAQRLLTEIRIRRERSKGAFSLTSLLDEYEKELLPN